ncbi:MAG: hypothetical protein J0H15_00335 [Xanthomonadales bacterium]|nr:hypothetical protein [Xanthomonadales bacterium]
MNSRCHILALTLAVACATASVQPAHACGEVMYRMGGALRYQAFATRHPADILLYGGNGTAEVDGRDRKGFMQGLERAGHHVSVAATPSELDEALARQRFDIIIVQTGDLPAVGPAIAAASAPPAMIPVLGTGDPATLREEYPQAIAANAGFNRVLKSIERTMESRGS